MTQPDAAHDARRIVTEVIAQLEAVRQTYRSVYDQVTTAGHLDRDLREAAIATVATVASCLRRLAPEFARIQVLEAAEQPDLELIVLRLLTDSMSVALAETPDTTLLVPIEEVDAILDQGSAPEVV